MSRTILVSSYPPRRCGIGAYAATQAGKLRAAGEHVTVISPPDGGGDVRVPFGSGRPFLRAIRASAPDDRVIVHFQPALYFPPRAPLAKVGAAAGLWWLVTRRRKTEILVHEADPPKRWRPDYVLLAAALRRAPVLLFHTEAERRALAAAYRVRGAARLIAHTDGVAVTPIGREDARRRLGVAAGEPLLVAAGFLHPDKGFERAVEALRRAGRGTLVIVGGVKDRTPANLAYAERLRGLAAGAAEVRLEEGFASDEDLDAWIAAADGVVLPYRRSWSSGVLARAQALGTPAIVSAVGGLPEQAGPRDTVVADDDELASAVARAVGSRVRGERAG